MNQLRRRLSLGLAVAALTCTIGVGAAISLDTTFNAAGTVPGVTGVNFGPQQDLANDVAVQADQRAVVVGSSFQNFSGIGNARTAVAFRVGTDGLLDSQFTGDGTTVFLVFGTPAANFGSDATAVTVQTDQKIVIIGNWRQNQASPNQLFVIRLLPDGSFDNTFSADGWTLVSLPALVDPLSQDVALQSDGSIIVVGNTFSAGDQDAFVLRLTPTGSVDTTFGTNGLVRFNNPADAAEPFSLNAVQVLTDDRIVAAGGPEDFAVVRLTANGTPDTTFSGDGIANFNYATGAGGAGAGVQSNDDVNSLAMYGDGRILLAGYTLLNPTGSNNDAVLVRVTSSGALDTTFGTNGFRPITDFSDGEQATDVVIRPSGDIVFSGVGFTPTQMSPNGAQLLQLQGLFPPELIQGLALNSGNDVLAAGSEKLPPPSNDIEAAVARLDLDDLLEGSDATPDPFVFTDRTGVSRSSQQTSDPVVISGTDAPAPISVSGGSYSIGCTGNYTTAAGEILPQLAVCVRHTSAATPLTATDTVLTIGGVSDTFTSTTLDPDTVPDQFNFVDQTDVALSTQISSASVQILGINEPASISVIGGSYALNCTNPATATYVTAPGTVGNNVRVCVRHTSAATGLTAVNTTLTVGGVSDTFTSTTVDPDTTPDAFSFADQTSVPLSATVTSAPVTITGINTAAPISVTGGLYSIGCTATYVSTAGTVSNNATVCVRHTSAATLGATTDTILTIGGVTDTFTSTTVTSQPFADRNDVDIDRTIVSNSYTVAGVTGTAQVSVTNGRYSIGCTGTYVTTQNPRETVENGDTICLSHVSAATLNTATVTTLTIGANSFTFTSRTTADRLPGSSAMDPWSLLVLLPLAAVVRRRRIGG